MRHCWFDFCLDGFCFSFLFCLSILIFPRSVSCSQPLTFHNTAETASSSSSLRLAYNISSQWLCLKSEVDRPLSTAGLFLSPHFIVGSELGSLKATYTPQRFARRRPGNTHLRHTQSVRLKIQTHKRFKIMLFIRTKTQHANFRGNPLYGSCFTTLAVILVSDLCTPQRFEKRTCK